MGFKKSKRFLVVYLHFRKIIPVCEFEAWDLESARQGVSEHIDNGNIKNYQMFHLTFLDITDIPTYNGIWD